MTTLSKRLQLWYWKLFYSKIVNPYMVTKIVELDFKRYLRLSWSSNNAEWYYWIYGISRESNRIINTYFFTIFSVLQWKITAPDAAKSRMNDHHTTLAAFKRPVADPYAYTTHTTHMSHLLVSTVTCKQIQALKFDISKGGYKIAYFWCNIVGGIYWLVFELQQHSRLINTSQALN